MKKNVFRRKCEAEREREGGERESERERDRAVGYDGGFFLACEDFGRMFDNLFPACASFFFSSFLFQWGIARAH